MKIKTGDTVIVISGDDKGKVGKVLRALPATEQVIVEGVNQVTKHVKPRKQGETGGIVKTDGALYACKVQLVCPKCGKAVRPAYKVDGDKKIRYCRKCNAEF